ARHRVGGVPGLLCQAARHHGGVRSPCEAEARPYGCPSAGEIRMIRPESLRYPYREETLVVLWAVILHVAPGARRNPSLDPGVCPCWWGRLAVTDADSNA